MKSRRLMSITMFIFGIGLAAAFLFFAAPEARAQQPTDDPETLREQAVALAAQGELAATSSAVEMSPSVVVTAPLFVGVDNAAVPTYQIDPDIAAAFPAFTGTEVWGAAYDPENNRVFFNAGATLYEWPVGGAVNPLGTILGPGGVDLTVVGLAFYDGSLYATRNISNEAVYLIDTTTLSATVLIDYADDEYDFGGLAFDPSNGLLYGTNDDATPNVAGLYQINPDATATLIAPYPVGQTDIDGLAVSDDGRAFLVTDEPGNIYIYDFPLNSYTAPISNPWSTAEVFSAGAWIFDLAIGDISLSKTAGTDPNVCAPTDTIMVTQGTDVTYCYEVTNTGLVTLTLHDLEDSELGVILSTFNYSLTPGASIFLTQTATLYNTTVNTATWAAYNQIGYTADDTIPYAFEDISGTGTPFILGDDDVGGPYPLGFAFNFYGTNYLDAYASSNGFLTMLPGSSNGCCTGRPIPSVDSPNGIIAGWWEDLDPPELGSGLYYETRGTAPNRRFIVQFTDVQHFPSGNPVTFQYKLFEGSNLIEVHYAAAPSDGGTHSAGVENQDGTLGTQYYFGTASLGTPRAVRYTPSPAFPAVASDTATVNVLNPEIAVAPATLEPYQGVNMVITRTLAVSNVGQAALDWELFEAAPPAQFILKPSAGEYPLGTHAPSTGAPPADGTARAALAAPQMTNPLGSTAYGWNSQNGPYYTVFELEAPEVLPSIAPFAPGPFVGAGERAGGFVYMVDTSHFLYKFNPATGTLLDTLAITPPPVGGHNYTGMAVDPTTGDVYGSTCDIATSDLYQLDVLTGNATLIGTITNSPCTIGIAIDGTGQMYGYDIVDDTFLSIDKASGAGTVVGPLGFDANFGQGMAWDPATDQILLAAFNNGTFQGELRLADRATGGTTYVGTLGAVDPGGLNQISWVGVDICIPGDIPWASAIPLMGTTAPGNASQVSVTFDATGLSPGTYAGNMCVFSNDFTDPLVVVPLSMTVSAAAVDLTPAAQARSGLPGSVFNYTFTVRNPGLGADTYNLSVSGNTWTAVLSAASVGPLAPGESHTVTLTVTIPAGALDGDMDSATVTATSTLDPLISDSAIATSSAVIKQIYLPVTPRDD